MKFTFPPESRPLPGFTIKRAIHRGGFGEVYYGLTDAGKEVALKLLHQHTDVELRGATACLNLNHPNLVTIYDIKTDPDGDHWVVMEYVGGTRLSDLLDDRGRLPVEEIERWVDGITAGLTFLHDRGIVHRDLKPSNVFSENGIIKVGDVGLSKFISESKRSAHTQSVGTVYYMAPEVARGRYGREVDVYALGTMIFEMFTGDVPFDGESSGEILMKHLSEAPDLQRLPPGLRPVIARSLEKDPRQRTPTVARLRDEFKSAVRGRSYMPPPGDADEEPLELPEDSFIDTPGRNGDRRATPGERERARFAAAQHRADDAWRRHRHSQRDRAAVASAFGPGPRGCPPAGCGRRDQRRRHLRNVHQAQNRGHARNSVASLFAELKQRPWLIALIVIGFLFFTRAGRGMAEGIFPVLGWAAIVGAYGYLAYVLWRYFTGAGTAPAPAPVHVPVNAGRPAQSSAARQYVAAPAVFKRRKPTPTPETRRKISAAGRASQLSGALTTAALVTAIVTACVYYGGFLTSSGIVFFGASTLLASWLMLSANKLVEGTAISKLARRLMQGGVGIVAGTATWFLQQYLMFATPSLNWPGDKTAVASTISSIYSVNITNGHWAYIVFFGLLMCLGPWWHATDSYRNKRYSIWRAIWTAILAFGIAALFPMPLDWALVWAVGIFSVVQLSAPWTPPAERVAARE